MSSKQEAEMRLSRVLSDLAKANSELAAARFSNKPLAMGELANLQSEISRFEGLKDNAEDEIEQAAQQGEDELAARKAMRAAQRAAFRKDNKELIDWALGPKEFSSVEDLKKMDKLYEASDKIEGGGLDNREMYCTDLKCAIAHSKGLSSGKDTPSTKAAIRGNMVKDDLIGHNIDPINPTNDQLQAAKDRINASKQKFCEANNIPFKPFSNEYFGCRSAAELHELADWREKNGDKFKTKEEIKNASKAYLKQLDAKYNYQEAFLNPLKQNNLDFKFYEVDPSAPLKAPNIPNSQAKTLQEQKSPANSSSDQTTRVSGVSDVKDDNVQAPQVKASQATPPLIARQ